jgi:DNA-binding response OmpR family regulator
VETLMPVFYGFFRFFEWNFQVLVFHTDRRMGTTSAAPCMGTVNVLVAESVSETRQLLRSALVTHGFTVTDVETGSQAVDSVRRRFFHLVLLDVQTPGISGLEACWQIRAFAPRTGIILAARSGDEDQITALEAGADDCVAKPFRLAELAARFRAVLRRTSIGSANASALRWDDPDHVRSIESGVFRLDPERGSVWRTGKEIRLSLKEFDLLALFVKNEGLLMSRSDLLSKVWGSAAVGQLQNLRAYICRLRQKLEDDPRRPRHILTESWLGYRFYNAPQSERVGRDFRYAPEDQADFRALHCRIPAHDHARLIALRIDDLRKAVRKQQVSFPSQAPTFERHDRPDLQWRLAQLYFVLGWRCEWIAKRYNLAPQRVRQILMTWKRRAVEMGYIQYIPPAEVLNIGPLRRQGQPFLPQSGCSGSAPMAQHAPLEACAR